jgi:uncharacterized cupin superfamily protein
MPPSNTRSTSGAEVACRRAPFLALGLLLAGSAAWAQGDPGVMMLSSDGTGGPPIHDYSIDTMKIRAAEYYSSGGSTVGYSWVDGPQYLIANPKSAEVLHVSQGEVTYVDEKGGLHTIRPGDVLMVSPGLAYTARDGKNYSHNYVVFPLTLPTGEKIPQMQLLRPSDLKSADFSVGPQGGEHVYRSGESPVRVLAWRPSPTGSVKNASENRYIAVTAGSGRIVSGNSTTPFKSGDTLFVRKGTSYSWSATDVEAICVAF